MTIASVAMQSPKAKKCEKMTTNLTAKHLTTKHFSNDFMVSVATFSMSLIQYVYFVHYSLIYRK